MSTEQLPRVPVLLWGHSHPGCFTISAPGLQAHSNTGSGKNRVTGSHTGSDQHICYSADSSRASIWLTGERAQKRKEAHACLAGNKCLTPSIIYMFLNYYYYCRCCHYEYHLFIKTEVCFIHFFLKNKFGVFLIPLRSFCFINFASVFKRLQTHPFFGILLLLFLLYLFKLGTWCSIFLVF